MDATDILVPYYGQATQIVIPSIAGIATATARASNPISLNGSPDPRGAHTVLNYAQEIHIIGKIKTGAASTTTTGLVNFYVASSIDGSNWSEGLTPGAAVTLTSPPNIPLIGAMNAVANSTSYTSQSFCVSTAFAPLFFFPPYICIVVENQTGGTLSAAATDFNFWAISVNDRIRRRVR